MNFLTSSQETPMQPTFENLWPSSDHGAPFKKKVPMAVHCLPISLAVQSLAWSGTSSLSASPPTALGHELWESSLLASSHACFLVLCLLTWIFKLFPVPWVFCLIHFHQTLWWTGVGELWVTWSVQCTILEWGPKPQTRVTYTLHQSHPGSFILRMTLRGAHLPNNTELLIFRLRLISDFKYTFSFLLIPICYHCS